MKMFTDISHIAHEMKEIAAVLFSLYILLSQWLVASIAITRHTIQKRKMNVGKAHGHLDE